MDVRIEVEKLVKKAKKGDSGAFGDLYRVYFPKILQYLARRTADLAQAEDLTEETFLKAFQSIEDLKSPEAFTAWLYTIARGVLVDFYRKSQKQGILADIEKFSDIADHAPLPDQVLWSMESALGVRKAMEVLPENYKEVLELRFWEDLSISETAKVMGKSAGAIRVLQFRALASLKEVLERAKEND